VCGSPGVYFLVVLAIGGVVRPLEQFWQAIPAFLADVAVMVAVSLVTEPSRWASLEFLSGALRTSPCPHRDVQHAFICETP
jgi:hypothetical protein